MGSVHYISLCFSLSLSHTHTHTVPPACLIDLSLGTHEYITANGIKFHCVINGDPSKQVMFFFHGYPEVSYFP